MEKENKKILIIDGNALIHRSFHAIPPSLRTKKGVLVNAVFGFTSFLLKALAEFKPEYIVLTLDKAGKTFRHESFSDYKATRTKAPDELYEQIPIIKDLAKAFNIKTYELSGFEADDLIGTICKKLNDKDDLEKIIITGDMDTLQLINKNTKVYTMSRGLSDSVLYDIKKVKERYNLRPNQIIDYKSLRGDPSDNIPGVKGVGEKTAIQLLNDFDNLENLYNNLENKNNLNKIKERIQGLLSEYKDNAYLSQKLATINKDAPIDISLNELKFPNYKNRDVIDLFQELEFNSLIKRLDLIAGYQKQSSFLEEIKTSFKEIENNQLEKVIKNIEINEEIYIETEYVDDKLLVYLYSKNLGYLLIKNSQELKTLKNLLTEKEYKIIGHNLKKIIIDLKKEDINIESLYFDTEIAAYLLQPNNRNFELEKIALNELGLELNKDIKIIEKIEIIKKLKNIYSKKLIENDLDKLFHEIEMPIIKVLADMEINGITFNVEPIQKITKVVKKELNQLENDIHKLAKKDFNINSTKQLKEVLFVDLQIPSKGIKKTKTGFSTAEDQLEKIVDLHPIISKLLKYREYNKLLNTYLSPLPKLINPKTNRIHTHFHQTITATGRLSSSNPNLQNIPNHSQNDLFIRQAFVSKPGWKLLSLDYSQIELRISAFLSQDKKMINAFLKNQDVHQITAAAIYNVTNDNVSPKMRQAAKAVNFGIIYGQGPHGLSQASKISFSEAKEFIEKYFQNYPKIKEMTVNLIKLAKDKNYAETLMGRKRPLPEIHSSMPMLAKSAERMAINTPIQGTAADIIKKAMIEVYQEIKNKDKEIKMLLQVHDELIFEVRKDLIDKYENILKNIMSKVIDIGIPLKIESSCGDNWSQLK